VYRSVIEPLVMNVRAPTRDEIRVLVGADQVDAAIERLGRDDLAVLSTRNPRQHSRERAVGANRERLAS
jgi:hypothetical protein